MAEVKEESVNEKGYLVDKQGNVLNNFNSQQMFRKKDLDERGEVPAPFNIEKYNFNPHKIRGNFDYYINGNVKIQKDKNGIPCDKRGNRVTLR